MGKAILAFIVLGIALAGGGYYNYQRNAPLDADLHKPRPFKSVSTPEVDELLAAYQSDLARLKGAIGATPGGDGVIDRFDASDVGGKAKGFASFQRDNERWKAKRGQVFEFEKTVEDLRLEKSIRDRGLDVESTRIWRRITSF